MKNENRNEEAVSPVIATILMVAITVVLAGVLYVWASSLADQGSDASFEPRVMSGSDAGSSGDLSTEADDALIRIDFDFGSEVNWGYVNVQITVEGILEPMNCGNSLEAATEGNLKCYLVEFGNTADQLWTAGDGAMLYENGQDLCSAACEIDVKITNSQTDDPLAPGFTAEAE
jgi:flagellin-like protein